MNVIFLHPQATPDHVGFIPEFLHEDDPRPAREQFNERYSAGWIPFAHPHQTMDEFFVLHFPGDPPQDPLAMMCLRHEKIFIYQYGVVAIVQPDLTFETCRMD